MTNLNLNSRLDQISILD